MPNTENARATRKRMKHKLIVSDQKNPTIDLKPGMRLDVVSVSLVDDSLNKPQTIGARLCGGTSTCIALIEINPIELAEAEDERPIPAPGRTPL
jgi:hypothetical protein